jgi:NADH-quinone oxidoreductase subunit I
MKWGMFYTGEYVELITSSAILVTLFFGGYHLPFLHRDGISVVFGDTHLYDYRMNHLAVTLISALVFFGKTIFMTFIQIFFRWTLPRFRYDQVMKLGWTRLLPMAIANMLITGIVILAIDAAPAGVKSTLKLLADLSQAPRRPAHRRWLRRPSSPASSSRSSARASSSPPLPASPPRPAAPSPRPTRPDPMSPLPRDEDPWMAKPPPSNPWTKPAVKQVVGKPVRRSNRSADVQAYIPEFMKGLAITMRHFFKNTKEMALGQKPDPVLEGAGRGRDHHLLPRGEAPLSRALPRLHRLTLRDDGSPRCVACLCCSTACPAQCISIEPGEYPEGDTRRGYERYPVTFVIDELRCIFCGFCVEACPCDAIRMDTGKHAVPYDSRDQFIYEKDLLMSFTAPRRLALTENPRHEPGDKTHPGINREHEH